MGILRKLLACLPQRRRQAIQQRNKSFECLVEDIYQVTGVGTVISGVVTREEWKKGDPLFVGPLRNGSVFEVVARSSHMAQTPVDRVWAGHSTCFAIPVTRSQRGLLQKGMVAKIEPFQLARDFEAEICFTKGQTVTIQKGRFTPMVHILHSKTSLYSRWYQGWRSNE